MASESGTVQYDGLPENIPKAITSAMPGRVYRVLVTDSLVRNFIRRSAVWVLAACMHMESGSSQVIVCTAHN